MKIEIPISPRTKKNSQQIICAKGHYMVIPSKLYKDYEKACKEYIPIIETICYPVNIKCTYYMPTRRKVDLNNLLEATTDMLVHYNIIEDDNRNIVASHDGSIVMYDKENPRTIIEISKKYDYEQW